MAEPDANTESISVYARVRAGTENSDEIGLVSGKEGSIRARALEFHLDKCFDESATQVEVFDSVGVGIVGRVVDGFNGCIIAYGQTGSGKTFTMLGADDYKLSGSGGSLDPGLGLVPRCCALLFEKLPKGFTVTASYIEVYNDSVNDCLGENQKTKYLALRETAKGHIEPDGLTRVPVSQTAEVMKTLGKGDKNRVVAAMAMNPRSSRGHGMILLDVFNAEGLPYSRLTLVDLAGMESSKKSAAVDGASNVAARREEAKRINMSLLALSSVVSALASKGAMRVPFRDSKLTRLLQSSLGGNCKAAIVVTVRSEKPNVEECINTLRFAQRAKSVQATVVKVEDMRKPAGGAANKRLAEELEMARGALADFQEKLSASETYKQEMYMQVQTLMSEMADLQKEAAVAKRNKRNSMAGGGGGGGGFEAHGGGVHGAAYVANLERRVAELEEENRVLRQRDVMHRMLALEGEGEGAAGGGASGGASGGGDAAAKPTLKLQVSKQQMLTFTPIGFGMQVEAPVLEREQSVPTYQTQRSGSALGGGGGGGGARRASKWNLLRAPIWWKAKTDGRWVDKRKVHPAPQAASRKPRAPAKPRKKLSQYSGEEKRQVAATRIQATWRGFVERKDLDYWDQYADFY